MDGEGQSNEGFVDEEGSGQSKNNIEEQSNKQSGFKNSKETTASEGKDGGKDEDLPKNLNDEEKKERREILKNVLILSIAFVFLFTSYGSMSNLQSSINKVDGTTSLTVLYAAYIVSCCFVPSYLIRRLGERLTVAFSMLCYSAYIAAQFYPSLATLVPTAIVVGLGAAPLWSAKCTLLAKAGRRLAQLEGARQDVVLSKLFGVFFMFFQSTQVWGNIISSSVLSIGVHEANRTEEELSRCGYNFCPGVEGPRGGGGGDRPPLYQIYIMASVYLCCSLLAALIVFVFVRDVHEPESEDGKKENSGLQLVTATFNHLRHPYQLLVIPITIWSGVEQAFLSADFTAAYVSCGPGVHMVGYVLICYGVCDAVSSLALSRLVRLVGRAPVFTLAFGINTVLMAALSSWVPRPDGLWVFFLVAGLWGMADAVWQTQINTLYGVLFPGQSEVAFSNYRLWENTGFIIAYACSTSLCVASKMTILSVFLAVGMAGYYAVEACERWGGLRRGGKVVKIDRLVAGWLKG